MVLHGFLYESASASAGRNRLAKTKNKVDNITKTATSLHLRSVLTFSRGLQLAVNLVDDAVNPIVNLESLEN